MYGKVWNRVNIGTDSNTVNHLVYQLRPCTMYMTLNARTLSIRVKSNFEMQLLLLTNLVEDISVTAPRSENDKKDGLKSLKSKNGRQFCRQFCRILLLLLWLSPKGQ